MADFINELTGSANFRPETNSQANAALSQLNPGSVLDKDDFLKLFLTELQNQDPTSPIDTDKMISQTANLTAVESQQNMQTQIEKLVGSFQQQANFNSVGVVGKIADTGLDAFATSEVGEEVPFELFFENNLLSAEISITDTAGNVIKTIPTQELNAGVHPFNWDGTDNSGNKVQPGVYKIDATYKNAETLESQYTKLGLFKIDSVRFLGDEAEVRVGSEYLPLSSIREIREPGSKI